MIAEPLAILAVLAAVVHLAIVLEARFRVFRALGSVLVAILLGMALSNTGVLPDTSPVYSVLSSTGVSVALVLVLLSVDVRSIVQAGPRMLAAFLIGAAGTVAGVLTAVVLFASEVGPETWKLAGQYTGTYIGGGVNFAALGREFDTSSDVFSAAVAADVGITALWLIVCLALPALLGRPGRGASRAVQPAPAASPGLQQGLVSTIMPTTLGHGAALAAAGLGLVWLARALARVLPVPEVLLLTTLVLVAAQVPAIRSLPGAAMWGNYLLHLFLAANGAQSVMANIFRIGPVIFWFAATTVAVHGLVIFGVGRLARLDAGLLAVASQANIGGPSSAMALAGTRGYTEILLPGIAAGLLGYAIGNYLGMLVAGLVRGYVLA